VKITATITGEREVAQRFENIAGKSFSVLRRTVQTLGVDLQRHIQLDYLSGQVLKNRTGHLRSGINERTSANAGDIVSTVGISPSTPYGAMWELGIAAHDVFALNGQALRFQPGGSGEFIFRRKVHIPAQAPRPFMKPALESMRGHIRETIAEKVRELDHE